MYEIGCLYKGCSFRGWSVCIRDGVLVYGKGC